MKYSSDLGGSRLPGKPPRSSERMAQSGFSPQRGRAVVVELLCSLVISGGQENSFSVHCGNAELSEGW